MRTPLRQLMVDITMDPFSVFYNFFCWKDDRCMTTGHREINLEDMKLDIRRNPDYFVEFIKSGETMLKVKTPAMFYADIETIAYLPSHSHFSNSSNDPCPININNINNMTGGAIHRSAVRGHL